MKLIHLSDLHIGKRIHEFSMLEDQEYILTQIINITDNEKADAVIIAGDVYDKSVPSAEAVELFDDFLVRLAKRDLRVFVISGNHDSAERIAFGGRIMDTSGIHMSPVYGGNVKPVVLEDEYGKVNIYMLPFVRPGNVRRFFPDNEINSYTEAVAAAIGEMNVNTDERNVMVTHQFVTGASASGSEELSVGGEDNVSSAVFEAFDYTALGHIHRPQNIGSERIRYCGTPLKYDFSEANHEKSVTVVTLGEKGSIDVRTVKLEPMRDMIVLKGDYNTLTSKEFYEGNIDREAYVKIVLTDNEDITDAAAKLRCVYHNLMTIDFDNERTRSSSAINADDDVENKTPSQLFEDFYTLQNNIPMTAEQVDTVEKLIEKIWEEDI